MTFPARPTGLFRTFGILALVAGLAACTDSANQYTPSSFGAAKLAPGVTPAAWSIADIRVSVPDSLTVSSDPDQRVPGADIVWWGEPGASASERRQQVAAIIGEAVTNGLSGFNGSADVVAEVTVIRFHGLTPRARASCSILGCLGNTNVDFEITVRDAATGDVLASSGLIEADPETVQGEAAELADQRGETDRARIVQHISGVVRDWAARL